MAPNVFTPDGDGINDIFAVFCNTPMIQFSLSVRADDDHLVFMTSDPTLWWFGDDESTPEHIVVPGRYSYHVALVSECGVTVNETRSVQLVVDHENDCFDPSIEPVFGDMFDTHRCGVTYSTNDVICVD